MVGRNSGRGAYNAGSMPKQPSMLEDAIAKAGRLVAGLERDRAAMSSSRDSNVSMIEGERLIGAAADAAHRLLQALGESADM